MRSLYSFGIRLYGIGIHLAAFFGHQKARLWTAGRRHWRTRYPASFSPQKGLLWMHVSSLGEFEQGRPVLEAFRRRFPERQVVLTFFSPSGYEIRKNYAAADFVAYLPADTPENARFFLNWLNPSVVVWVKYDFWANYLLGLQRRGVPVLLISALFRPDQYFFKWYGGFWRRVLGCFTAVFLQKSSAAPPMDAGRIHWAGDTRVDRVLQLILEAPENPVAAAFSAGKKTLIAGSTWPKDEALLIKVLKKPEWQGVQVVLAPHDVSAPHIRALLEQINEPELILRYSEADPGRAARARWLVIDNIGLLNALYRYGWVAWIGGGFGKGIHNTLEPAAWGLPVLFGPNFHKFEEAVQLVASGGAFPVEDAPSLENRLAHLGSEYGYTKAQTAVREYMEAQKGATGVVMEFLQNC